MRSRRANETNPCLHRTDKQSENEEALETWGLPSRARLGYLPHSPHYPFSPTRPGDHCLTFPALSRHLHFFVAHRNPDLSFLLSHSKTSKSLIPCVTPNPRLKPPQRRVFSTTSTTYPPQAVGRLQAGWIKIQTL